MIETGRLDAGAKFGRLGRHHDTELRYLLATQLTGTRKSMSQCSLVCVRTGKSRDLDEINALSKSTPIVPWYDLYDYYPLTRCLDLRKGKFTRAGKKREYPQSTAKLYGQFVLQIGGWCL